MERRPSRHQSAPAQAADAILPGHYRTRLVKGGPWQPVLVRVENSTDDEGRVADRPRLVLYLGGERHERPRVERWQGRLHAITAAEYQRLVHSPFDLPADQPVSLQTQPSLF